MTIYSVDFFEKNNINDDVGKSTAFIEFMISAIKASLIDATKMSDDMSDEKTLRLKKIEQFLQTHEYIMNADVRELCCVSAATANRILAGLTETVVLKKYHINGYWKYKSAKNNLWKQQEFICQRKNYVKVRGHMWNPRKRDGKLKCVS